MSIDPHQLAAAIKQKAREVGFDLVGITDAGPSRHADFFRNWLAEGRAGEMHYLHERADERIEPARYFAPARTAICVALNYHAPLPESPAPAQPARFARYTLGRDYHEHFKDRLYDLADWLRATIPGAQTRSGVDTVPVMERELAARAGIGWVGKNTCVINERVGSWIFLGEILTSLDLPLDEPATDRCGTCRRCIEACPTGAITAPYVLDASRCISYLTIEHRSAIPPALTQRMGDWVFGCDICQDVCPWNRKAPLSLLDDLQPRRPVVMDAQEIVEWSQERYWEMTRHASTRRLKLPQFQRNARIAQENAARRPESATSRPATE